MNGSIRPDRPASSRRSCTIALVVGLSAIAFAPLEGQRPTPSRTPRAAGVDAIPVKTASVPMRVLADALRKVVGDGRLEANSCGGSRRVRRFRVALPAARYSREGGVGRLEHRLSGSEVTAVAIQHSLQDPGLGGLEDPTRLLDIGKSGHPSPILHTITRVRLCVDHFSGGGWDVSYLDAARSARLGGPEPQLMVRIPLSSLRLKGRGMPAEYGTGVLGVDGLKVGIKWGHRITDLELPDYILEHRRITVRLTLVEDGRGGIGYGAARAGFDGGWGPGWSDNIDNFAPRSLQNRLLRYRNAELERLQGAVKAAFDDGRTRSAVARALTAAVRGSPHGVGSVVGIELATGPRALRGGEPRVLIRYR